MFYTAAPDFKIGLLYLSSVITSGKVIASGTCRVGQNISSVKAMLNSIDAFK